MKSATAASMIRLSLCCALITLLLLSPASAQQQLNVAILPFKVHSQENLSYLSKALHDMLTARLSAEGKMAVLPEARVEKALRDYPSPEAVVELGKSLNADWVIRGSLTKVGENLSIDAELINVRQNRVDRSVFVQGQGIDSVIPKVTELAQIVYAKMSGGKVPLPEQRIAQPPRSPATEAKLGEKELEERVKKIVTEMEQKRAPESPVLRTRPVLWQSPVLQEEIKGIQAADVDGDGKTELLVLHKEKIAIYRYTERGLVPAGRIDGSAKYNFLYLSLADMNGNGIPEIFVSGVDAGGSPRSFILEFHQGSGQKIAPDMNMFLRAVSWPGRGGVLLGQKDGPTGESSGPIQQLVWERSQYVSRGVVPIPMRAGIYDFTPMGQDSKGVESYLILNRDHQPHLVTAKGQVSWHLKESYAQSKNNFEVVKTSGIGVEFPQYTYVPIRLLAIPLGSGSGVRIILPKNDVSAFSFVGSDRRMLDGEVHTFIWDKQGLLEGWRISGVQGYVADILVKDINGDGKEELVVASVVPGTLGVGARSSRLLAYELPGAPEMPQASR